MCHDIEDPTMDATALATGPRARMRPVHRPPRVPANRSPHCEWVVDIDKSRDPIEWPGYTLEIGTTAAVTFEGVTPIDASEDGACDYAGPIVSDLAFTAFSKSALVRIAEEVSLQWQLLALSFVKAVAAARTSPERTSEITRHQFTGVAGLTSERLCRTLGLGHGLDTVLALHPAFQPPGYGGLRVAHDAGHVEPLEAILHGVDPTWHAEVVASDDEKLSLKVVRGEPTKESSDVGLVRFSKGAAFEFEPRKSLPLSVA